jgi:acyl carrier protein
MILENGGISDVLSGVVEVLTKAGNATDLKPDEDFYHAGITSIMVLPVLLDLEDLYHVSIPDSRFIAARTPRAIASMIVELQKER